MSTPGSCLTYVAPAGPDAKPVLVVHSWWGLTRSFKDYADALAQRGFLAGCVDLFGGRTAATEEEARLLRRGRREEPAYRTLQRAVDELEARGSGHTPAVVGFSMGGHWAVWLAQHPGPPLSAVVLYYSARAGDFSATTAPVLAHYAERDPFVSRATRQNMERALAANGLAYEPNDYPGTGHWFAESDSPAFDPEAARVALERTTRFLDAPPDS